MFWHGSRRPWAPASLLCLLSLVSGCGGLPQLQRPGGSAPSVTEGNVKVKPGQPWSIGSMMLCLSAPGTATITAVRTLHPVGAIRVQAYAVRPSPAGPMLGDAIHPLSALGFPQSHQVQVVCGSRKRAPVELGVQLAKASPEPVGAGGFILDYQIDGHDATMTFPVGVFMCSPSDAGPPCRRLERRLESYEAGLS